MLYKHTRTLSRTKPEHMGAIQTDMNTDTTRTRTVKEYAEQHGLNPDSVRVRAKRKLDRTVNLKSILTADDWATMYPDKTAPKTRTPKKEKSVFSDYPPAVSNVEPSGNREEKKKPAKTGRWRGLLLYVLMLIPAAASMQNMFRVTHDIGGDYFAAICLTGLFSAAPFMFVLAGVRNAVTGALVAFMVLYEAFCNFTRIYGGLTGFGKNDFPTRFLGLVTDVFESGTHYTAIFLAAIMAALAASTFYAAYFELNKKK